MYERKESAKSRRPLANVSNPTKQERLDGPKVNLSQLPNIYTGRQIVTNVNTPKNQVLPKEPSSYHPASNLVSPPNEREIFHRKDGMPPLIPRSRSNNAIQIQNNLREYYKNMGGA